MSGATVVTLADEITADEQFAVGPDGTLYRYADGIYVPGGEEFVRREFKARLANGGRRSEWTSRGANEVAMFIMADARRLWDRPPSNRLNVRNGLLDISDPSRPVLLPHDPSHLSSVQLPVAYNPGVKVNALGSFLREVVPFDCVILALELFGVLMVSGLGIRWATLLEGPPGTGKSTFLRVIEGFLGPQNVSHVALHKLEADRFASSELVGKLANLHADLPNTNIQTTSIFRSITGGDPITAERKYRSAFAFQPTSRLIFSANDYPKSHDASDAFFDRWLVIPFLNRFRDKADEIVIEELVSQLTTDEELSGLLNGALFGLAGFTGHGNRYSTPPSTAEALVEFRSASSPVAAWVEYAVEVDSDASTTKSALLRAFNAWRLKRGMPTFTANRFGRELAVRADLFNKSSESQRSVAGKRVGCWLGIRLRKGVENG